jgi:seryl-tRNA synthetase
MIDLKRAKADIAAYKKNITDRNLKIDFDAFLTLEEEKNTLTQKIDELRNTKNQTSKEIPTLSADEKTLKITEMKQLGDTLEVLEQEYKPLEEKYNYTLHRLPNFLDPNAAI